MPALFLYLLKLSISLAIVWIFYYGVLRRLTFYACNRWYLAGYSLLSFFIPLIDIAPLIPTARPDHQPLYIAYIPAMSSYTPAIVHPAGQATAWDPWRFVLTLLVVGALLLLSRALIRWRSLVMIRKSATLISDNTIRIYQVDGKITPFSFGKAIYVNQRLHSEKEWEEIILHEYVHIRERHTLDILLGEAITILNWYNPFAWIIRHAMRQNLEFIADQKVLDNGIDKKHYQYHLLQVVGHPAYRLANNFNFSSLKKRIIMMNKMRSARLHLVKFLFLLPLLAVLLLAFRNVYPAGKGHRSGPVYVNAVGIVIILPGKAPLAGVTVREITTGLSTVTDENGYYKLHIPVTKDSVRIRLEMTKKGFGDRRLERFWPAVKETKGLVDVTWLDEPSVQIKGIFMAAPNFDAAPPTDPDYADARKELARVLQQNVEVNNFMDLQKSHPEISLFYTTEDKQHRLVIHKDGSVEKFGYPGEPSLADMDKKYPLPEFMTKNAHPVNSGYLARWAAIAVQAEKEFKPTGGDARAIIFPGDSRVIVVPAEGKPVIYDMDNNDPKERPAFEKQYGKLPACVPAPPQAATTVNWQTTPIDRQFTRTDTTNPDTIIKLASTALRHPPETPVIYVNGLPLPPGMGIKDIDPASIQSMGVLKGEAARALYGPAIADRGVILITTKKPGRPQVVLQTPDGMTIKADSLITPQGSIHAELPHG